MLSSGGASAMSSLLHQQLAAGSPRLGRQLARQQPVRCSGSPTRAPPPRPAYGGKRAKFANSLQQLWAVRSGGAGSKAAEEQRAEGHLSWADCLGQHYRTGRTVGRGAFGTVRLARSRKTGELVAVKVLSKSRPGQSKARTAGKLAREADCMAAVQDCDGVVRLRGLYEDSSSAYMVMDHCTGGDLEELVQKKGALAEHQAAVVLFEVLRVVAACHRRSVCHGDIKPANFLLARPPAQPLHSLAVGELPASGWLKAIDFGCAQQIVGDKPLSRRTGTPVYMAPEVFVRKYSRPADMWSVGMLLYHLLSARFPFWSDMKQCQAASLEEVMDKVTGGDIDMGFGPFADMSEEGRSLLAGLLVRNPAKRLSAEAAMQHDWFKLHLGWEAEAPRLVQTVLPQLVTAWAAAGNSAVAPQQPRQQKQPAVAPVVVEPMAATPAQRIVSPRPVKKQQAAVEAAPAVVANNVLPVSHKSGAASSTDERRRGTSSGGASKAAKSASKHVSRRARGTSSGGSSGNSSREEDGRRAAVLQPAGNCS